MLQLYGTSTGKGVQRTSTTYYQVEYIVLLP